MNLTREQVQAYLELEKKATPGPWKSRSYKNNDGAIWIDCDAFFKGRPVGGTLATVNAFGCGKNSVEDNAKFIAESRTIAPQLAEAYLQALDVLEKIAMVGAQFDEDGTYIETRYMGENHAECQNLASQFLQERSES